MSDRKHPSDRPAWTRLHLWEMQPIRDLLLLAGIVGLVLLGYRLSLVTVPLLLAVMLAYLFEPLVRLLERRLRVGRPVAAIGIIAAIAIIVVVPLTIGIGFAAVQAAEGAQSLARNVRLLTESVKAPEDEALRERLPSQGWRWLRDRTVEMDQKQEPPATESGAQPSEATPEGDGGDEPDDEVVESPALSLFGWMSTQLQAFAMGIRGGLDEGALGKQALATGRDAVAAVWRTLLGLGKFVFGACLTIFFFFFACTGYEKARATLHGLIPVKKRARAVELLGKMDRVVSGFVRGRLTIASLQIVYFTIAYALIGAPAPLLLGPLVGVLSIVPYLGLVSVPITVGAMFLHPAGGMAFQSQWWWIVFAPIVVYWLGQALDDYVLSPLIQSKATDMDTPTILFASIAGGLLAGVYGLLLAIPVAACAKILIVEVLRPRILAWTRGEAPDPLPLGDGTQPKGGSSAV